MNALTTSWLLRCSELEAEANGRQGKLRSLQEACQHYQGQVLDVSDTLVRTTDAGYSRDLSHPLTVQLSAAERLLCRAAQTSDQQAQPVAQSTRGIAACSFVT